MPGHAPGYHVSPRDRRVARALLATFLTAALPPTALSLVPAVVSGAEILPYSVSLLAIAATALGTVHVAVPTWRIRFQRVLRTLFLHGAAWILLFTFYALLGRRDRSLPDGSRRGVAGYVDAGGGAGWYRRDDALCALAGTSSAFGLGVPGQLRHAAGDANGQRRAGRRRLPLSSWPSQC